MQVKYDQILSLSTEWYVTQNHNSNPLWEKEFQKSKEENLSFFKIKNYLSTKYCDFIV